jgi:NNP family nitrate/nitrite transporter-like MFS transporter
MVVLFSLGIGGSAGMYSMMPLYLITEKAFGNNLANTFVGLSQISGLLMTFAAGWITDRVGEKRAISSVLILAGIATILLGRLSGDWLIIIIFIQPALITCFFPAGFSAFSRIVQPNLRSVAASFGPPSAFVLGGGLFPSFLGYMGQNHSFGLGIILTGCAMILGALLPASLKLIKKVEDGC